ncbi:MAG: hypothetical protein AMJ53_02840 [Gammaproteobacteria bacterium SG8_11]|nr:MAG: hypothetical protein AMJ53_02840 [Gammaproteobacteria bacterium SG8_11]
MTDPIEVQFDPPDLPKRFAKAGGDLEKELRQTMDQALYHIQDSVPSYPVASRKPQPFKSDKQRRFFFWALRSGRISVPYRRTGTLGRSLTIGQPGNIKEVRKLGQGVEGQFGTRTKYAPMVIGQRSQARYHQGTWWTLNEAGKKARPDINRLFAQMARRMADFIAGKGA